MSYLRGFKWLLGMLVKDTFAAYPNLGEILQPETHSAMNEPAIFRLQTHTTIPEVSCQENVSFALKPALVGASRSVAGVYLPVPRFERTQRHITLVAHNRQVLAWTRLRNSLPQAKQELETAETQERRHEELRFAEEISSESRRSIRR